MIRSQVLYPAELRVRIIDLQILVPASCGRNPSTKQKQAFLDDFSRKIKLNADFLNLKT